MIVAAAPEPTILILPVITGRALGPSNVLLLTESKLYVPGARLIVCVPAMPFATVIDALMQRRSPPGQLNVAAVAIPAGETR